MSLLVPDQRSARAVAAARSRGARHMLSTLAEAEVVSVVRRLLAEGRRSEDETAASLVALRSAPWMQLDLQPGRDALHSLAARFPLRGADLWHLASVVTLSREIPEVRLLSFDERVGAAAEAVGLRSRP